MFLEQTSSIFSQHQCYYLPVITFLTLFLIPNLPFTDDKTEKDVYHICHELDVYCLLARHVGGAKSRVPEQNICVPASNYT